jgi:hypothetical protein
MALDSLHVLVENSKLKLATTGKLSDTLPLTSNFLIIKRRHGTARYIEYSHWQCCLFH